MCSSSRDIIDASWLIMLKSSLYIIQVIDIVKHRENGSPVRRLRKKSSIVHSKNIAGKCFWNNHTGLLKELGSFTNDIGKVEPDYVRSFQFKKILMPSTWIVIRIDGCHFHR